MTEVLKISSNPFARSDADLEKIKRVAGVINSGGVAVYPTRGLYGLGADARNIDAVKRIFQIKKRDYSKPVSILVKDKLEIRRFVHEIPECAEKIMAALWPGKITLVFKSNNILPEVLTGGTGKIGLRLPAHPIAKELVKGADGPVTATSANISGRPGCSDIAHLDPELLQEPELVVDSGILEGGTGSTIVDVTGGSPVILRQGAVPEAEILKAVHISETEMLNAQFISD